MIVYVITMSYNIKNVAAMNQIELWLPLLMLLMAFFLLHSTFERYFFLNQEKMERILFGDSR